MKSFLIWKIYSVSESVIQFKCYLLKYYFCLKLWWWSYKLPIFLIHKLCITAVLNDNSSFKLLAFMFVFMLMYTYDLINLLCVFDQQNPITAVLKKCHNFSFVLLRHCDNCYPFPLSHIASIISAIMYHES